MMDKAGFLEELKQREQFLENEAFDLASLSERLDELDEPNEKPLEQWEIVIAEERKANNAKNLLTAIAGTMKALKNVRFMISRISSSLEMEGESNEEETEGHHHRGVHGGVQEDVR